MQGEVHRTKDVVEDKNNLDNSPFEEERYQIIKDY